MYENLKILVNNIRTSCLNIIQTYFIITQKIQLLQSFSSPDVSKTLKQCK